ncbi:pyridoxamine 5'-phosphate oxidase family protein [Bogoriella caseilytica]|uniref:PPOX class probable F420-dependent enzyme n=1 Tax=Bogoriella caseilytica TaxID=56055 RepID=A0A3N2BBB2_9MICO|nr:pyridoxamine 5'-phosphate oxidase family protein [Bogoriella caseilytica]ROR72518.1 PPOX class probable F420-dependent enzyme [Bogoriella caseilytica]
MTLPSDVRRVLEQPVIAALATVMPDGAPHSVPLWVGLEGEYLAFLTAPGSQKAVNIAAEPRVAISATDPRDAATMVMVRGTVVERVDGAAGWAVIDRIAQKYLGGPYPLRTDRVAFLVRPDRAMRASY